MSVDLQTVKRVAHLARIAVSEDDAERMTGQLNAILGFVEQLNEVDVSGVEPMTSVTPMAMKKRAGRGHRRQQGRRHRRQCAGDRREFLRGAESGGVGGGGIRDRRRNAAAGRCARAGRGAERHLLALSPPRVLLHLTVEQMAGEDTTVFVARDETARPSAAAR